MTADPTELSRTDMATRLLAIAVVEARIREEKARLREALGQALVTGSREAGYIDPSDPEGTALGFVTKKKGAEAAKVTDPDAVLAWVKNTLPDEVVTSQAVRPAFLTRLLTTIKTNGGWLDPVTGELLDVPGVEVSVSDPTLMVKANEDADRLVAEALAAHHIPLLSAEENRS